ncbi:hypothetical protein Syun_016114 [Stephania yunnanensis]|uniref:Uncharacterized protein n=1 Tax=Stephania yunnanensis TaxID=152371 RepID=A0AAP0J476_9MAGN
MKIIVSADQDRDPQHSLDRSQPRTNVNHRQRIAESNVCRRRPVTPRPLVHDNTQGLSDMTNRNRSDVLRGGYDKFDEARKFDGDGHDFVEDKFVFGDDGFVIEKEKENGLTSTVQNHLVDADSSQKGQMQRSTLKRDTETSGDAPQVVCRRGPEVAARGVQINRVANQARRRLVTTYEPVRDCYATFFRSDGLRGGYDKFDEARKFDGDGHDFVEDKFVFGDDGFVIEVISHSKTYMCLKR